MNKKIKSFGVIAILIIAGLVVLQLPASSSEVVAPFGEWQVLVGITDTDGNYIPMEIESYGSQILTVFIEDLPVSSITYTLKARATGEGFDTCDIYMSEANIGATITGGSFSHDFPVQTGGVTTLDVGSSLFVLVYEYVLDADDIDSVTTSAGAYTVTFSSRDGTVMYRGLPDGDWESTDAIPSASTNIEVTNEFNCYKCDGQGGLLTVESSGETCPDGYSSIMPDCTCIIETSYGAWGSWSNTGCVRDCYVGQVRYRDELERVCCPGADCTAWVKVGTDNDYREIFYDPCCNDPDVTCYQCDGEGNVVSRVFSGSCGSGWYSSPPDCDCYTTTTYGAWGSWVFQYCSGLTRYDKRTRTQTNAYCCPGGGCDYTYTTDTEWRHYIDTLACGGAQIVSSNMFYTVGSTPEFTPYYVDAEHYLGVARIST